MTDLDKIPLFYNAGFIESAAKSLLYVDYYHTTVECGFEGLLSTLPPKLARKLKSCRVPKSLLEALLAVYDYQEILRLLNLYMHKASQSAALVPVGFTAFIISHTTHCRGKRLYTYRLYIVILGQCLCHVYCMPHV